MAYENVPHEFMGNPVVSTKEKAEDRSKKDTKRGKEKTIGTKKFPGGFDATKFIKSIDPSNKGGAVPGGLDIMQAVKSAAGGANKTVQNILGGNLMSLIQKMTQANKAGVEGLSLIEQLIAELAAKIAEAQATPNNPDLPALLVEMAALVEKLKNGVND